MNLKFYYYYFQKALSEKFCNDLISFAEKKQKLMGMTGDFGPDRDIIKQPLTKKEKQRLKKQRDSNIVWLNDHWIYKEIIPWVEEANRRAGWKQFN